MFRPWNYVNEVGNRYGRLFVIEEVPSKTIKKRTKAQFLCKCDCGNQKIISAQSLRKGHSKSCGCLQKEAIIATGKLGQKARTLPTAERIFNFFYNQKKTQAKSRGYVWNLTKEQFKELTWQNCYYCGSYPNKKYNTNRNIEKEFNGLDRLNSSLGYEIDNVKPCCATCNKMKLVMQPDEFLKHIVKIVRHSLDTNFMVGFI